MDAKGSSVRRKFGTAPVFLTSISSILGAVLFLRFGFAVGTIGFWGVIVLIVLGHLITIPTALSISELATNTRVEGGGEYYIISRSFGQKIGSTIGVTLFLAQAISIAFYIIAFAEAFQPLFDWFSARYGFELPRQAVSIPTLLIFAWVILRRGTGSGVKLLYAVTIILFVVLAMFFLGGPVTDYGSLGRGYVNNFGFFNNDKFFMVFAICFPAFTGMTAGVGLSGDLKNPSRSIPLGTMLGTLVGLVTYVLVVWKLAVSAPNADLVADQMVMTRIALLGSIAIPIGLAASTSSSAIGAMMVAPRTLQAMAFDSTFPMRRVNIFFARGKGRNREPNNASMATFLVALVFIALGGVNSVAEIISMFFLITYGSLCLSSFLNHFGSPPSYRPRFKSRWYISLAGFVLSVWVMFQINAVYTIISYIFIFLIYLLIEHSNKNKKGLVNIFKGALFQINRHLQVFMQKHQAIMEKEEWRPSAICISSHTFEREKILEFMKWISHQHGFGTYFHFIEGYYGKQTHRESMAILDRILNAQKKQRNTLYIDTMVSPSYTTAIAQAIQAPSISGMESNMVVFEYDKEHPEEISRIVDTVKMVKAGDFDVCIYAMSDNMVLPENGIHVWVRDTDEVNVNFMILLGYIIMSHPYWKNSHIKIFITSPRGELHELKADLERRVATGRLPITLANIEIVVMPENGDLCDAVAECSSSAALTIVGFREEMLKHDLAGFFARFGDLGDTLFVNTSHVKEIN